MTPHHFPSVEPLESRIAPAGGITILVGHADPDTNDTNYSQAPFHSTHVGGPNYDAGDSLGANFVAGANTFYLKLGVGDTVKLFSDTSGYQTLVHMNSGNAVLFFVDKNHNNEVDANELTGISFGAKASATVAGDVDGDIVTNFNDLTGKIVPKGLVSSAQAITGLTVDNLNRGDSAHGSIVAGGSIMNLFAKSVTSIVTGTAANNYAYDFNSTDTGGGSTINTTGLMGARIAGPDISRLSVTEVQLIQAGNGGTSAAGGSISFLNLTNDSDGFNIQAGAGGNGNSLSLGGGTGGAVSTVFVKGVTDVTADSLDQIHSGAGGNGGISGLGVHGNGGAGGAMSAIYVNYDGIDPFTKLPIQSGTVMQDVVLVQSGAGGNGLSGGNGGAMTNFYLASNAPDVAGHEITLMAGNGGNNDISNLKGQAGAGGSISLANLQELNQISQTADILLAAGNAGTATGPSSNGNNGGSLLTATFFSPHVTATAGTGSDGNTVGGMGGSVTGIYVKPFGSIVNHTTEVDAGIGGNAINGKAGSGGNVTTVQVLDADLTAFTVNAGNAGKATTGTGGMGGFVTGVRMQEASSVQGLIPNAITVHAGNGGSGTAAGGRGGAVSLSSIAAFGMNYSIMAGDGGGEAGVGRAGDGGGITTVSAATFGLVGLNPATGTVAAGKGGDGTGFAGSGGLGGSILTLNAISDGIMSLNSGKGGAGSGAPAGAGGSITSTNVESVLVNTTVTAGSAGAGGNRGVAGGSIATTNILGAADITITAGNGGFGGAGGSLTTVGYSTEQRTAPTGTVTVKAGQGSGGGLFAGAGGSITGLSGFEGKTGTTLISAGTGGGVPAMGGAGGNITTLTILGGGDVGTPLVIEAGNAGAGTSATAGARGGSVSGVNVDSLATGAIVRSIAAGDGGAASPAFGIGGVGGTVTNVHVLGDIGIRSGQHYGYGTMGGIFAGVGGAGVTQGAAGSVTLVTANSIAAIVAGKNDAPQLATLVDGIFLNGNQASKLVTIPVPDGSFQNFNVANIVGAVFNPSAAKANTFDTGEYTDVNGDLVFDLGDKPQDGLIAAITLTNNRNFVPEAYLFASGAAGFFDYKNGQ